MSAAKRPIPERIRDEAAQWLARNQGDRPADAEADFKEWLAQDLRHRLAYAEIERAWNDSSSLANTRLGRERQLTRAPFHMRRTTHLAALSAVVILGVGLTSVQLLHGAPSFGVGTQVEARTYETARGETRTWQLANGASLTLGSASLAKVRLWPGLQSIVLERGLAHVSIVKTDGPRIEVTTAGLSAQTGEGVLNVVAYSGRNRIDVVSGMADAALVGGPRQALHAGQGIASPSPTSSAPLISTKDSPHSVLAMNEMSIEQAIALLNRNNAVQIHLASAEIASRHLAGAFRTDDPEAFANSVAALENVEIERRDRSIILRSR